MKKFLALIFAMLLALSMAACGDSAPAQPYFPAADGSNSGSGSTNGSTPGSTNDSTPGTAEKAVELTFGEYDGDTYNNRFLGMSFHLTDGVDYITVNEIREINEIDTAISADEADAKLREKNNATLMRATNEGGEGIQISVVKKNTEEGTGSLEEFEELIKTQVNKSAAGLEVKEDMVDGRARSLFIINDASGEERCMMYFSYEAGEYLVLGEIRAYGMENFEAILNNINL